MILMWWIASTLMWIAILLLLIVVVFLAGYYLYKKRGVSESNGATAPTLAKNFLRKLAEGKHQEEWWFPVGVAFVSYAVVLFFSSILLPEEIWSFWKETKLCWWLLAIIPIFVLGMKRGGIAGKTGAIMLAIISIVYLLNNEGFKSTFGESEVDRQARIAEDEMARQEEFLARQPKIVTLELPLGKWVKYTNQENERFEWDVNGNGCVAVDADNKTKVVCSRPKQTTRNWPSDWGYMPKPITSLSTRGVKLLQFYALDEPGKVNITTHPREKR